MREVETGVIQLDREVYKVGGDKSSLQSEVCWRALQSAVIMRIEKL